MLGNLEYELESITKTPTFLGADEELQQDMLRVLRDDYIKANPKEAQSAEQAAEEVNKRFLRATGQGRHIPKNLQIEAPWQSEDFSYLSEDERVAEVEKFKTKIPEIAAQDTLNKEDNAFYLNQVADAQIRAIQGEDTGYIADKAYRAFDGFAAGMANYMGATEMADNIRRMSSENPKYDEDFAATLFQGAGDMAASTAIFLGAALATTAVTGSPVAGGYAGTAATLGTNSISRYNEAYRKSIEKGLNENQAHEAGIYSLPGAAIDALGDRLIASKLLPNRATRNFKGSDVAKRQALIDLTTDKSKRGVMMEVARNAFVEGASEAVGDYTAGYGAYLATGEADFMPKAKELRTSFAVGAILGGGITAAADTPGLLRGNSATLSSIGDNIDKIDVTEARKVYDLIGEGKYKEALQLSQVALQAASKTTSTPEGGKPGDVKPGDDSGKPGDVKPGDKPIAEKPVYEKPDSQKPNSGININSEAENEVNESTFLAKDEKTEEKQQAAAVVETKDGETRDKKEERAATAVLDKMKVESKNRFKNTVVRQIKEYMAAYSPFKALANLGSARPETSSPDRNIRVGTGNIGASRQTADSLFVRSESERVNNVKIVDPSVIINPKGVADFSVLDRAEGNTKPVGETNITTAKITTKIEEAIALGRSANIVAIAPVNIKDHQFLQDNNIPFLDLAGIPGLTAYDVEGKPDKYYYAETAEAVNTLVNKLDKAYGKGRWAFKNSVGFGGKDSVFTTREEILAAFEESKKEVAEENQSLTSPAQNDTIAVDEMLKNVSGVDVEVTSTVAETGEQATYSQKASTILEESKKEKTGYETLINCLGGKK